MNIPMQKKLPVKSKTRVLAATSAAKILEIGPLPPPFNGWSARIGVVKDGLESVGHECVVLNIGENRATPSEDYECVRSGTEYLRKLIRYAMRGYTFHIHTNGDSPKAFILNMIAYFVGLAVARRPVLTFHAGTDQVYFPRQKSRVMVPLFKFLFGAARVVICDNPHVGKCIAEYGVRPEKIFPISPFTRQYLETADVELEDDVENFLRTHSPIVLTYVECRSEYDLDTLFGVCSELVRSAPDIGFVVVGATRERQEISERLRAAGIGERTFHVGAVDHDIFLSLLRRVTVYLRSAKTEGTSASIREALFFGVPVVANNAKSQPEGVFVYAWGNAEEMLETVEAVLRNSNAVLHSNLIDVPDTVSEEVDILVHCARKRFSKMSSIETSLARL